MARAQGNPDAYFLFVDGADQLQEMPEVYIPTHGQVPLVVLWHASGRYESLAGAKVEWTINGKPPDQEKGDEGYLAAGINGKAMFRAPDQQPQLNPVTITASFLDTHGGKTKIILYCKIHIADAPNFFFIGGGNTNSGRHLYAIREPVMTTQQKMFEKAMLVNGNWVISVSGFDRGTPGDRIAFTLTFPDKGWGRFDWATEAGSPVAASVTGTTPVLHFLSVDCQPHGDPDCKPVQLHGVTWLLTNDTNLKQLRGYFWGSLSDGKDVEYVSGGFAAFY